MQEALLPIPGILNMDEIERMKKARTALEIALKKSETYQHRRLPNPNNELQTTRQPVPAQHSHTSVTLGEALQDANRTGKTITLGVEEMFAGLHVLGVPRHGKTALLINLFLQLAEQGYGCCYVDPHGDALADINARLPRNRIDDVIILDPTHETHAFGLNLLTCDNVSSDTALTYAYNQLWSVFNKVWADKETGEMGIWMQKFVSNAILTFLEHPGYTVADIPLLLTSKPHREYFARTLKNSVVARFWTEEFEALPKNYQWVEIESTLTRLNRFLQNPLLRLIVGQSKSTLNFRHIMDTKKLLLVHFPVRLPEDFRTLLGTMLITQLQDAMFSRSDTPKPDRVPFFLIVDEVQEVATKQFTKFFEEGGKYHVATIAAHQHLFQEGLSVSVRNGLLTAGNKVSLRVSDNDAEIVAPGYAKAPEPEEIPHTIPANVLEYLDNSEQLAVQSFSQQYVDRMRRALGRKPRYDKEWGLFIQHEVEIPPKINFGEGLTRYDPDQILEAWYRLNALVFEACQRKTINRPLLVDVLRLMAGPLQFSRYYNFAYATKALPGPTPAEGVEGRMIMLDSLIRQNEAHVATDQAFLAFLAKSGWTSKEERERRNSRSRFEDDLEFLNVSIQPDLLRLTGLTGNTPEAIWESMKKQAKENAARVAINTFEKIIAIKRSEIQSELDWLKERRDELTRKLAPFKYAKEAGKKRSMTDKRLHYIQFDGKVWRGTTYRPRLLFSPYTPSLLSLPYSGEPTTDMTNVACDCHYYGLYGSPLIEVCETLVSVERKIPYIEKHLANDTWVAGYRERNKEGCLDQYGLIRLQRVAGECAHLTTLTTPEQVLAANKDAYIRSEIQPLIENRRKLLLRLKLFRTAPGNAIDVIADSLAKQEWKELNKSWPRGQEDLERIRKNPELEEKAVEVYHREKASHDRFVDCLRAALVALTQKPIQVESAEYIRPVRIKDEREMIATAARELRNLPKYQAFCKLVEDRTTAVYHIALPPLPPPHRDDVVAALTKRIWSRMETDYYRPKKDIEEEIAKRQKLALPDRSAFAPMPARQRKQGNSASGQAN